MGLSKKCGGFPVPGTSCGCWSIWSCLGCLADVASLHPVVSSYRKEVVKKKRERIVSEFGKLHRLLADEEKLLLQKLEEEEKRILLMIHENLARLVEQKSLLEELILEIKEKTQQPADGLLKVRLCPQPHYLNPDAWAVWEGGWGHVGWWVQGPAAPHPEWFFSSSRT